MKYQITFQCDYELPDNFFNWTVEAKIEYLSQWDYGDYHEPAQEKQNMFETISRQDDYILIENRLFGYAALNIELQD